jgi:hypothetical protein
LSPTPVGARPAQPPCHDVREISHNEMETSPAL